MRGAEDLSVDVKTRKEILGRELCGLEDGLLQARVLELMRGAFH